MSPANKGLQHLSSAANEQKSAEELLKDDDKLLDEFLVSCLGWFELGILVAAFALALYKFSYLFRARLDVSNPENCVHNRAQRCKHVTPNCTK